MKEVRIGRWRGDSEKFEFGSVKDIGQMSGPKEFLEKLPDPVKIVPIEEIRRASGMSLGSVNHYLEKRGCHGIRISKKHLPEVDVSSKGGPVRVFYKQDDAADAIKYYGFKKRLERDYRRMTDDEAKRYFGFKKHHLLNRWLRDFEGEKDEELERAGLNVLRKPVAGQTLFVVDERNPVIYIPKALLDEPEKMAKWANSVRWEKKRMALPEKYRDHLFLQEIRQETRTSHKVAIEWMRKKNIGMGINTQTGETHDIRKPVMGSTIIVPPSEAKELKSYLKSRGNTGGMLTSNVFAKRLGIEEQSMRSWLGERMRGRYGEEIEVFGLKVNPLPRSMYVSDDLLEGDISEIKSAKAGDRLGRLEGILSERMKEQGKRRGTYHPEVQKLLDEGMDFERMSLKNKELSRWGISVEATDPPQGSDYRSKTFRIVQK